MEKHYSINPIETAKYIEESYHTLSYDIKKLGLLQD